MIEELSSLTNSFLVASPTLDDPFFHKAVIYISAHDKHGAMGMIINHPTTLTLEDLIEHLSLDIDMPTQTNPHILNQPILKGGPLETQQGFILFEETIQLPTMSASEALLKKIIDNSGPKHHHIFLGYAGWQPGQLEEEIRHHDWLTIPYDRHILFGSNLMNRWEIAIHSLGFNQCDWSDQTGSA